MRILVHVSTRPGQAILARGLVSLLARQLGGHTLAVEAPPALSPFLAGIVPITPYAGTPRVDAAVPAPAGTFAFNGSIQAYPAMVERYGIGLEALVAAFNAAAAAAGHAAALTLEIPAARPLNVIPDRPVVEVPAASVLVEMGAGDEAARAVDTIAAAAPAVTVFATARGTAANARYVDPADVARVSAIGDRVAALVLSSAELAIATDTEANRDKERLVIGDATLLRYDGAARTRKVTTSQELLALVAAIGGAVGAPAAVAEVPTLLVVSHRAEKCGVAEYGRNFSAALQGSQRFRTVFAECDSEAELRAAAERVRPDAMLYNRNSLTMRWLTPAVTRSFAVPQIGIMHEVDQRIADAADTAMFDAHLAQDPTLRTANPAVHVIQRLLPVYRGAAVPPADRLSVGSFGFAHPAKGFERLVARVCDEFDEADVRLHLPANDIVDPRGEAARAAGERAHAATTKPGVRVIVSHDYRTTDQLLDFLAGNHLNAFFYDPVALTGEGISSVLDYALAVRRPLAITSSGMFRTITSAQPPITIEHTTLRAILANGFTPLQPYFDRWQPAAFLADLERVLTTILEGTARHAVTPRPAAPASTAPPAADPDVVPVTVRAGERAKPGYDLAPSRPIVPSAWSGHRPGIRPIPLEVGIVGLDSFNVILDDRARRQYAPAIARIAQLCPETIARKIPEANVQQAFVFDTVQKLARLFDRPRILAVGSFEDTASEALIKAGYAVEEIDPELNYDLATFVSLSTTRRESYDIVFSTSVLEHVEDDETFVRQMGELIAPGGFGILTVDFHDAYVPGVAIPEVDYRWYTQRDFHARLMPQLGGTRLLGAPRWECPNPDFHMAGYNYTFATLVVEKVHSVFAAT